jgi:hypothetical protein
MFATASYREYYRKRINVLCGQSAEVFLNVTADGTYG